MYSATRATTQAYRAVLAPWDLTYTQFLVLVSAAAGPRSVHEIGADLGLDSGTISPLLRRLESRGLITRHRDASDERMVMVALSDDGDAIRYDVEQAVNCLTPAYGLTDEAQGTALISTLNTITARMHALVRSTRRNTAA